jgi:hypothetical protein
MEAKRDSIKDGETRRVGCEQEKFYGTKRKLEGHLLCSREIKIKERQADLVRREGNLDGNVNVISASGR